MSNQWRRQKNTIYALNDQGTNRWWANFQKGYEVDKRNELLPTSDDELEAVINMVVAAPELYEALEELERMATMCDDGQYIDYPGAGDIFSNARAALAKARGEE